MSSLGLNLGGSILAALKRRRSKKEQVEHDTGSTLVNYLIPGFASYNGNKRLGRSQGDREEDAIRQGK